MNPEAMALPATDEATHAAFRRLLLGLADSKRLLGIRYSDWLLGAPSIEAGIAASSMAQDEWGHARLLYASLKDLGEDPVAMEHDRDASAYASMEPLDMPFTDWARFIAGVVVVDGALSEALEGVRGGSYGAIEGRLAKMLSEEEFHRSLAEAWFRRLAASDEGARRLRSAVEAWLPLATRYVAPGDRAHERLADAGLTAPAAELRQRLSVRLEPMLALLGLGMPSPVPLPDDWDAARGRGTGQPAAEAVVRARGDRNRALFVE